MQSLVRFNHLQFYRRIRYLSVETMQMTKGVMGAINAVYGFGRVLCNGILVVKRGTKETRL